ncbi:hypothetical protein RCL1_000608 [Eukaryota sp. TZLM3-RCL]
MSSPSLSRLSEYSGDVTSKRIRSLEKALSLSRKENQKLSELVAKTSLPVKVIADLEDQVTALSRQNLDLSNEIATLRRIQQRHEKTIVESTEHKDQSEQMWMAERRALKDQLQQLSTKYVQGKEQLEQANESLRKYYRQLKDIRSNKPSEVASPVASQNNPHLISSPSFIDLSQEVKKYQSLYSSENSKVKKLKVDLKAVKNENEILARKISDLETELSTRNRDARLERVQERSLVQDLRSSSSMSSPLPSLSKSINSPLISDPLSLVPWQVRSLIRLNYSNRKSVSSRSVIAVESNLTPNHVFGSRNFFCNPLINYRNDLIFPSGCLISIYSDELKSIKYFAHHGCDVTCLSLHSNGVLVASGQSSNVFCSPDSVSEGQLKSTKSIIILWDSVDMSVYKILNIPHSGGIASVVFSRLSTRILTLGLDDSALILTDYSSCSLLKRVSLSTPSRPLSLCVSSMGMAVSTGLKHAQFWSFDMGEELSPFGSLVGNNLKEFTKIVTCCVALNQGICVAGTSEGYLVPLKATTTKSIKNLSSNIGTFDPVLAHSGPILSICVFQYRRDLKINSLSKKKEDTLCIVSSSSDFCIKFWSSELHPLGTIYLNQGTCYATSLACPLPLDGVPVSFLYVGMSDGSIIKQRIPEYLSHENMEENREDTSIVTSGHGCNIDSSSFLPVVTALGKVSDEDSFVSSSLDGTLRVWNVLTHKEVRRINIGTGVVAMDTSSKYILVGLSNFELVLYSQEFFTPIKWISLRHLTTFPVNVAIIHLSMSPSAELAVVLTSSNHVIVLETSSLIPRGTMRVSCVQLAKAIDWTKNGSHFRVCELNDVDPEPIIFDSQVVSTIPSLSVPVDWFSSTLPGLSSFSACLSTESLVTVIRHCSSHDFVIVGDESGGCSLLKSNSYSGRTFIHGHSAAITGIIVVGDYVVSCSNDGMICISLLPKD